MEINTVKIPYESHTYKYSLVPLGDIHYGDGQCDIKYFEDLINWIKKQKDIGVIGMGDYCNCIVPTDKRFDMDSTTTFRPAEQYDYIYKQFHKIKDKILGLHIGHHGDTIRKHFFENYDLRLANDLGVPYLDWEAFTTLQFQRIERRTSYTVYSCHGWGGGRRTGTKINKIEDLANFYEADIYLMGHLHTVGATRDIRIGVGYSKLGNFLTEKKRIFALTGTMLKYPSKGVSGYEARMGYKPTKVGVVKIKLYPETKDIHISE